MIRTASCIALLVASLQLSAQSNSTSPLPASQVQSLPGETLTLRPYVEGACPISMHATQGMWDHTVRVKDGETKPVPPVPLGQRISLSLKDDRHASIVAATVRVRGLNGTSRKVLTPTGEQQDWNAVTTLKVKFAQQDDGSSLADLRVAGFTAVNSVQLINVSYSDGSTWRSSKANACSVQPDPLMLITER